VVSWARGHLVAKLPAGFSVDYQFEVFPLADLDTVTACGILRPHENLPWLAEWIAVTEKGLAENDWDILWANSGTIWHTTYRGQELFITNMNLRSSRTFNTFDCEGNFIAYSAIIENEEDVWNFYDYANILKFTVIYSNTTVGY
jgi:hypothetical protein